MPQWDLANSDCILVMGSNMAENHPIAFRFALQAKDKGATIIHADPRFTRTSALADIYAPVRAGTDVLAGSGSVVVAVLLAPEARAATLRAPSNTSPASSTSSVER